MIYSGFGMIDLKVLEQKIKDRIARTHKLGEHAGGSGHLAFRSLIDFKMESPKEIMHEGKKAYDISYNFGIYTETEFLHPPEQDELYTERHEENVNVDDDLNLL